MSRKYLTMGSPIIYYWSSNSGGTRRVAEQLKTPTVIIDEAGEAKHPFVIMTPSFDQPRGGFTPKPVEKFLEQHGDYLIGVIGCGNVNFLHHYCQAAADISKQYCVPTLWRLDVMGNERDYQVIDSGIATHWQKLIELKGL